MAKISPTFERQLRAAPDLVVDLIIRTAGPVAPHLKWLEAAGFRVKQQFRLSPGVALSGPGRDVLALLDQDWVVSIEPDAPVQAV